MWRLAPCLILVACGSPRPPVTTPPPGEPAPVAPDEPAPVASDAAVADAGPSADLAAAPAWVFRYNAPPRVETWTLRHAGSEASVVVESAGGRTMTYLGTASDGATLKLEVATQVARLTLDCKRARRAIGTTCTNGKKAAPLDLLDCYHPDFKEPMTFGPAPGVEYAASCNGYQRIP